jgi:hypothetical protein
MTQPLGRLEIEALAHKLYLHASYDGDWLTVFICWAIITKLSKEGAWK